MHLHTGRPSISSEVDNQPPCARIHGYAASRWIMMMNKQMGGAAGGRWGALRDALLTRHSHIAVRIWCAQKNFSEVDLHLWSTNNEAPEKKTHFSLNKLNIFCHIITHRPIGARQLSMKFIGRLVPRPLETLGNSSSLLTLDHFIIQTMKSS